MLGPAVQMKGTNAPVSPSIYLRCAVSDSASPSDAAESAVRSLPNMTSDGGVVRLGTSHLGTTDVCLLFHTAQVSHAWRWVFILAVFVRRVRGPLLWSCYDKRGTAERRVRCTSRRPLCFKRSPIRYVPPPPRYTSLTRSMHSMGRRKLPSIRRIHPPRRRRRGNPLDTPPRRLRAPPARPCAEMGPDACRTSSACSRSSCSCSSCSPGS